MKREIYWDAPDGLIHVCEGDYLTPGKTNFCLWTKCGKHDVPANEGYYTRNGKPVVTCAACIQEAASHEP